MRFIQLLNKLSKDAKKSGGDSITAPQGYCGQMKGERMEYTEEDRAEMEDDLGLMLEAAQRIYNVENYRRLKTSYDRIRRILNREGNK